MRARCGSSLTFLAVTSTVVMPQASADSCAVVVVTCFFASSSAVRSRVPRGSVVFRLSRESSTSSRRLVRGDAPPRRGRDRAAGRAPRRLLRLRRPPCTARSPARPSARRHHPRRRPRPRARVTSRRTASTAASSTPVARRRAADDQHDLPARRRLRVARRQLGRRPAHDLLVELRQLPADRDRPRRVDAPPAPPATRPPAAATRTPPASRRARTPPCSSARLRGRKPTKRHTSAGSADATSAASAALGPGSTSTSSPAATQPCTSTSRGRTRAASPRRTPARRRRRRASAPPAPASARARCARGSARASPGTP